MRFAEGELVCYNKPSGWLADWGPPGPDLCQCSADHCFQADVCSCRTCSRDLRPEECFSINQSYTLGCPSRNMYAKGEVLLMSLEALRHVPILPRGLMTSLLRKKKSLIMIIRHLARIVPLMISPDMRDALGWNKYML